MKHLLFIALIACNTSNQLLLVPANEKVTSDIAPLVEHINEALGCKAIIAPGMDSHNDRRWVRVSNDDKAVNALERDALGYYNPFTDEIFYENFEGGKDYTAHMRYLVLAHEVGHAMGLDHEDGTIMQAALLNMFNTDAVASLAELLNKHGLNPCTEMETKNAE